MSTGMQTGRRTGSAPMRTGAAPAAPAAGGIGGIMQKWNEMDMKKRIIIMSVVGLLVIGIIVANVMATNAKPIPLFASDIAPTDASEISNQLAQWGIPYSVAAGGTNVLVPPSYKHRALLQLADVGLPKRPVVGTANILNSKAQGMVPDTKEDKDKKLNLALEGDMTMAIRQIKGVADAYVKIVPKPQNNWGEDKASASAAIMLKLYPGAKLSGSQIDGIVHLVSSSVGGLDPANVKVMDTNGKILNNKVGDGAMTAGEGEGGYNDTYGLKTQAEEKRLKDKVQDALDKALGPGRSDVAISVEMDFSQVEQEMKKIGGPGNVSGEVITGKSEDSEVFNQGAGGSKSDVSELSGSGGGEKSDYEKRRVTVRYDHDTKTVRKVDLAPRIKRVTCSVMVDGVKDKEMIARIETFAKNAVGYDPSRGDEVTVVPFTFTRTQMMEEMASRSAAGSNFFPQDPTRQQNQSGMPSWLPVALAIPLVLLVLLVAVFYMKQKSVQKEKQRLVLTSGPGATVSDISDLLADKEGKVTPPPATKVNTSEQLEQLAKEKPTKVAELLKSTWLADR